MRSLGDSSSAEASAPSSGQYPCPKLQPQPNPQPNRGSYPVPGRRGRSGSVAVDSFLGGPAQDEAEAWIGRGSRPSQTPSAQSTKHDVLAEGRLAPAPRSSRRRCIRAAQRPLGGALELLEPSGVARQNSSPINPTPNHRSGCGSPCFPISALLHKPTPRRTVDHHTLARAPQASAASRMCCSRCRPSWARSVRRRRAD
jgi:hypothetical protein